MAKTLIVVAIVGITMAVCLITEIDCKKPQQKPPPPDDVYYERNTTCVQKNSGPKAKMFKLNSTTQCRCVEKMWMRCVVRSGGGSTTTTESTTTSTETTSTSTSTPAMVLNATESSSMSMNNTDTSNSNNATEMMNSSSMNNTDGSGTNSTRVLAMDLVDLELDTPFLPQMVGA